MPFSSSVLQKEIATRQEIQRRLDLYPLLIEALREACDLVARHGWKSDADRLRALLAQAERQES